MNTRTSYKGRINIITLGCSKNQVDSEVMAAQLTAGRYEVRHESHQKRHDVVIVNTCGFIEKAKEESIQTILEQVEQKKRGNIKKVFVTGCLSERYRKELQQEIPEVDAFFGTLELPLLLKQFQLDFKKELIGERLLYTPSHYAYLKISEGCNRTCSFCAIPLMRGKHVSKPTEEILHEAKHLVQKGVKEIMLIAQELTYYGLDLYKKRTLAELLNRLCETEGLEWIRLHYAYPARFPTDVLDVMREQKKICRYLDMPLQHASDRMLKAMRRQITRKETEELIFAIREKVPGICLRTTLITGFPGETEEDFEELKEFITRHRFERVGVFTYSHEEGTTAFALQDVIPFSEKQRRADEIMKLQQDISYDINQQRIGETLNVMVDSAVAGKYIGRTEWDSPEVDNEVIIHSDKPLRPGDFVQVKITKAYDYDLEGTAL
ncbi:MAG: 30S ribosomal protein S12 methylthiotransferase RimO [Chitinophagaceae bacterium]|nr:30S ribosomal protein S12 methylthiotransferase RimO [Chitinophagaceae bacterium]